METKFRRAGSEGSLCKVKAPVDIMSHSKKNVRASSLTGMRHISGSDFGNICASQNRFLPLADLEMEDTNDMELEEGGENTVDGLSMPAKGTSAVEQSTLSEVNR